MPDVAAEQGRRPEMRGRRPPRHHPGRRPRRDAGPAAPALRALLPPPERRWRGTWAETPRTGRSWTGRGLRRGLIRFQCDFQWAWSGGSVAGRAAATKENDAIARCYLNYACDTAECPWRRANRAGARPLQPSRQHGIRSQRSRRPRDSSQGWPDRHPWAPIHQRMRIMRRVASSGPRADLALNRMK